MTDMARHPLFDNVLLVGFGDAESRAKEGEFLHYSTREPIPAGTLISKSTDSDDGDFYEAELQSGTPDYPYTEWVEVHRAADGSCDLCGEPFSYLTDEVGEFWDGDDEDGESVIAHAQCGIDHGLQLA